MYSRREGRGLEHVFKLMLHHFWFYWIAIVPPEVLKDCIAFDP
jgi:hypothetical protein